MSKYNTGSGVGMGCLVTSAFLGIYCFIVYLLSFWTDRNLDFWFSYFKGREVDIPQWLSFLVSFVSPVALAGNILMELFKFAI